jgi:hypothetical protein
MRRVLLALWAVTLTVQPAAARDTATVGVIADPHERVYETLIAQADDGPMIEAALDWMVRQLASDPNIALLAKDNPGLLNALRAATRPIIVGYSRRVKLEYRPRMIALLRSELTAAEATDVAAFYASPIGRRLVAGVSASYRPDTVLGTIDEERRVTSADVARDMDSASQATLQNLSPAEVEELNREIESRPAIAKLVPVVPKIAALRAQMEEEPLTAEEEAAVTVALRGVFETLRPIRKGT